MTFSWSIQVKQALKATLEDLYKNKYKVKKKNPGVRPPSFHHRGVVPCRGRYRSSANRHRSEFRSSGDGKKCV